MKVTGFRCKDVMVIASGLHGTDVDENTLQ